MELARSCRSAPERNLQLAASVTQPTSRGHWLSCPRLAAATRKAKAKAYTIPLSPRTILFHCARAHPQGQGGAGVTVVKGPVALSLEARTHVMMANTLQSVLAGVRAGRRAGPTEGWGRGGWGRGFVVHE